MNPRSRAVQSGVYCLRCLALVGLGVLATISQQTADASDMSTRVASDYGIEQVALINNQIRQVWDEFDLEPSRLATNNEWCRRVYLDVLGRIPTVGELQAFLAKRSSTSRKVELITSLLYDETYQEQYARNWATIWTNLLIGRGGGNEENSLVSRSGMQQYLRESFSQNRSYDQMVYELIGSEGTNRPGSPGFNGAVNFLAMKVGDKALRATAQTARLFLGLQVQCTQCHNHPFNEWKQSKFWEMNAFFRQTVALRRFEPGTRDIRYVEIRNQDFAGEDNNPLDAAVFYEQRNGQLSVAYPVFVDGTSIKNHSGFVADVNRRETLASLVIRSNYLPVAAVNRIWSHFLGYGFCRPVDDMGPHNPPTHPELLEYLATEFCAQSFDLKRLIQWIVLSEAYSLSSRMNRSNASDDPQLGDPPKFSHFYLRQMRAEELYESLIVATRADKTRGSFEERERVRNRWLRQFTIAFGTDEGDETTTFNGTIPQALMLFNGDLIQRATGNKKGSVLDRIAQDPNVRANKKIEYLFLAGLARKPSRAERRTANRLLVAHYGDTTNTLQDVWWAILNSNEFILNH